MAKITVIGTTVSIISGEKLESIKLLEKYKPSALVLKEKDEDGKTQEIFRVGTGAGQGAIGKYGANFGGATNAAGNGVITVQMPDGVDDVAEYVADKFGLAVINLNKVEAGVKAALDVVEAERDAIMENITIE